MNYARFLFPFILMIASCDDSVNPEDHEVKLNSEESKLIGVWDYAKITVNGTDMVVASETNEPKISENAAGGARGEIRRRYIQYFEDKTYALGWYYWGEYRLGTSGTPNWQPSFGNWSLRNDSLIHNPGMLYEKAYGLKVSNNSLQRKHERYMSEDHDLNYWRMHEVVPFEETFFKHGQKTSLTLELNMNDYADTINSVHVNGSWSNNWKVSHQLTDMNQDGIWEVTFDVLPFKTYKYKFNLNEGSIYENLNANLTCTSTIDIYTDRIVTIDDESVSIATVCWEKCKECEN